MASPKPQVTVSREFELTVDVTDLPLQACIIGPSGLAILASERADIVEEYHLEGGWQAPEKTGFLTPETDGTTGDTAHSRVSIFGDNIAHPYHGMGSNEDQWGALLGVDISAELTIPTGAEVDESTVRVDVDDALIRLARTATLEATLYASAYAPLDTKNVIDFGVNVVGKPGHPRNSGLVDDVKVGDVVAVSIDDTGMTGDPSHYVTTIIGFNTNDDGSVTQAVLNNNIQSGTATVDDSATAASILRQVSNVSVPKLSSTGVNWRYINSDTAVYWGGYDPTDPTVFPGLSGGGVVVSVSELGTGEFECAAGIAYASFTAYHTADIADEIQVVEQLSDIREAFGDDLNPNNPLAWAVYTAKLNSGGVPVFYIQTSSQSLSEYTRAVALSEIERSCYSIVPCTENSAVHSLIEGHIVENSDPLVGRFRIGWFAPEVEETRNHTLLYYASGEDDNFPTDVYDSVGAPATIGIEALNEDGSAVSSSTTVLQLNATNATNPFAYAEVGDLVYINATASGLNDDTDEDLSYADADILARITDVVSNDTAYAVITQTNAAGDALLAAGIVTIDDETFIQSVQSGTSIAAKYAQTARGFDNERVFMVVSDRGIDGLKVNGNSVKNIYAAAAFAGLRSQSAYQQPLSNVTINGFDGVNDSEVIFTETNMGTMRDAGVWLVRQPKTGVDAGEIFAQRQLSTSNLDIYRKEQSVTTNIDNIAFSLLDALNEFVGRMNITPRTILLVRDRITAILREKTIAASATLGPQLLSYEIISLEQVESSLGTLKAQVSLEVPLPMNTIDITLVV
tara:strand:+ start:818 stop:3211 length:2394 start_codon:yes stop_codon:yes gene_type:complete